MPGSSARAGGSPPASAPASAVGWAPPVSSGTFRSSTHASQNSRSSSSGRAGRGSGAGALAAAAGPAATGFGSRLGAAAPVPTLPLGSAAPLAARSALPPPFPFRLRPADRPGFGRCVGGGRRAFLHARGFGRLRQARLRGRQRRSLERLLEQRANDSLALGRRPHSARQAAPLGRDVLAHRTGHALITFALASGREVVLGRQRALFRSDLVEQPEIVEAAQL